MTPVIIPPVVIIKVWFHLKGVWLFLEFGEPHEVEALEHWNNGRLEGFPINFNFLLIFHYSNIPKNKVGLIYMRSIYYYI